MEPIIERRERDVGTLLRVFPNYIEVKPRMRGARTIPMRHVERVDLNWMKTKVTICTRDGEKISLVTADAEDVRTAILQNLP